MEAITWGPSASSSKSDRCRASYAPDRLTSVAGAEAEVKPMLEKARGYQGDAMNLPVRDIATAVPFYETVLGFRVVSRHDSPLKSAVLARDEVRIALAENGGDSSQDGCAFHVRGLESLVAEFKANGLQKLSQVAIEQHDDVAWKVFYVVAPDGLCYWFGERQSASS